VSNVGGGDADFRSDLTVAFMLLNDARHRVLHRYLGVNREQGNLVTAVALLMVAEGALAGAQRARRSVPHPPSLAGTAMGMTVLTEGVFRMLAGVSVRNAELAGSLVLIVVIGKQLQRRGHTAMDGVRAGVDGARRAFGSRYGHRRR